MIYANYQCDSAFYQFSQIAMVTFPDSTVRGGNVPGTSCPQDVCAVWVII